MMKRLVVLILAGVIISCSGEAPEQKPVAELPWFDEGPNILTLLNGATVRDRSGERSFQTAALHAIDGHPTTAWSAPPYDLKQWVVIELAARSRIHKLGLHNGSFLVAPTYVKELGFEWSLDGREWSQMTTLDFELKRGLQLRDVQPFEAKYLRVTALSNHGVVTTWYLPTILAEGEEVEPWKRPDVTGRWTMNDLSADLRQEGKRVYGRIDLDPPMVIDGGWDGRVVRFAWVRGRNYGVGFLSVAPEGDQLNGSWWYENTLDAGSGLGTPWYGRKSGEADSLEVSTQGLAQLWLERDGRFPLYDLTFLDDGTFDVDGSRHALGFLDAAIKAFPQYRVRLEVNEFHSKDKPTNLEVSRKRAEALRAGLQAAGLPMERFLITPVGSEREFQWHNAPVQWTMFGRIDFSFTAVE